MSRYAARLRELEKRLAPPERPECRVVLWVHDDDPPRWAQAAIRPYHNSEGVTVVEWTRAQGTGELNAVVNWQRYSVTPDGCEPTEPAFTISLQGPE